VELGAQMRAWAGGVGVRLCMRSMSYDWNEFSLYGVSGRCGEKDIRKGMEEKI
jgi:hypothetical protein